MVDIDISNNYARDFVVPLQEIQIQDPITPTESELDMLTNYVRNNLLNVRRGDTVSVYSRDCRYRNEGTYIFDGLRVINLQGFPDEYGTLPKTFEVSEVSTFHPRYWQNVIAHNNYWWPSENIREDCKNGIVEHYSQNLPVHYTTFNLQGQTYTLLFDSEIQTFENFLSTLNNHELPFCYGFSSINGSYDEIDDELICSVCSEDYLEDYPEELDDNIPGLERSSPIQDLN